MEFSADIKPFLRQCLVTTGVSICMMEHSLVMSYTGILIPQLRNETTIYENENKESWIASVQGISLFLGALMTSHILSRYGRRKANLLCASIMIVGWLCIILASNITTILIGRFTQGLALGISSVSGSVLVGEYTSPKYRGGFLTKLSLTIFIGSFISHILGSFLHWRTTAAVCLVITIVDLIVIYISPESPMFLVTRGKFDECRKVFHWLRGSHENEELEGMIKAEILCKETTTRPKTTDLSSKISAMILIMKDPQFFKPLLVMLHLDIINMWSGGIMIDVYASDIFQKVMGSDTNVASVIITVDCVRIALAFCAVFIHTKFRRRPMLILFVSLNVAAYFLIAGSYYFKSKEVAFFNNPKIGFVLIIFHAFTTVFGAVTLSNILAGEIFPLRFKAIESTICILFLAVNITIKMKTVPYLFSSIGLSGAYCLYGCIIAYGLIVAVVMMPETKGKSLLIIENYWKNEQPTKGELASLAERSA
ncbi:facilitated trehalose transporter Tret1-like [Achroia grisella]|uniref:facilitated trehalose transporter Tret1-like n=1 Tax=Achroia grisella TaxID=688607 RepID=UPI0027D28634|nr:facilitated trehalose transporter Tret1-like [Achroia grisella]XP_059051420.1 facilitated trehalose transporter Tret1-like [Achroia grisella]